MHSVKLHSWKSVALRLRFLFFFHKCIPVSKKNWYISYVIRDIIPWYNFESNHTNCVFVDCEMHHITSFERMSHDLVKNCSSIKGRCNNSQGGRYRSKTALFKITRSSADADNRLDAFSSQSRSTNMVPFSVHCDFSLSM